MNAVEEGMVRELGRRLKELEACHSKCADAAHLTLDEVPVDEIRRDGAGSLMELPLDQAMVWHRDVSAALARVGEAEGAHRDRIVDACIALGRRLGEVPRDTFYTYAARAHRLAPFTFSNTVDETTFVLSLQTAAEIMSACTLMTLGFLLGEIDEAGAVEHLVQSFARLSRILSKVIREVRIEVFVSQIEPNFRRLRVGDEMYYGPTAAQLPLVALETVLHGSDASDNLTRHVQFQKRYLPPALRDVVDHFIDRPGILSRFEPGGRAVVLDGIQRFRKIHFALARRAFALQESPSPRARAILEALLSDERAQPT
jgi:hypothetical protein